MNYSVLVARVAGWNLLLVGMLIFSPAAWAQEAAEPVSSTDEESILAGHSYHGEAFNDGPRQAAYLMEGTGRVHLPITSSQPEAQRFFDQGVGQLHGYWYFEAERSFRQVAALDPDCAMAYWGMAMANVNNAERAKKFIAAAHSRRDSASPREQKWIDAWHAYYAEGKSDDKTRRRQLVRALETIVHEYPDELEALAFLCAQIYANHNKGLPVTSHQAVDALIAQVLAVEPAHPVHHYRIHIWDNEKAAQALPAAAACGPAAPAIAHMWHMPGHIYSKLRRYGDAAWQQEASGRVDHAYMIRDRVMPDQIHNYAHNQEWMIRNLSHIGRVHLAERLAKNLIELPRHPRYNTLSKRGSAQYGFNRLLELLARYERWEALLAAAEQGWLPPVGTLQDEAKRLRGLGAAQFSLDDRTAGEQTIARLNELLAEQREQQAAEVAQAEQEARDDKKSAAQVKSAANAARKKLQPTLEALEAALAEVEGYAAWTTGDATAAVTKFQQAAKINASQAVAKTVLSRALLDAGDTAQAEKLAREAVAAGRNEVVPLANQVFVLERMGKQADAETAFKALRAISAQVDLDMRPFERLQPIARRLGCNDDWRQPAETPTDLGPRPELNTLGPFRWRPAPAPSWKLASADGKTTALSQYRGRPVIVIFYLGFGCLHCVEQLQTFSPRVDDFREAGIELVAISSESAAELATGLAKLAADEQPRLPLLADEQLDTFRAYRAFDDFENQPLHGTFLIDGAGRVRWQDISYEPYTDAEFLLHEAQRLLAFEN